MAEVYVPRVYDITRWTRGAKKERQRTFLTIEARHETWRNLAIFSFPAVIITMMFWGFIGPYATVFLPVVILGGFWLFTGQTRQGLRANRAKTIVARHRSSVGRLRMCGHDIESLNRFAYVRRASVPLKKPQRFADVFQTAQPNGSTPRTKPAFDWADDLETE